MLSQNLLQNHERHSDIYILNIDNLKQWSYLKCSYLKMGSHGNALAVSFFRRLARLLSRAHDFHDFHYRIEKRCGKLGRYVSFIEIHGHPIYRKR